jgi:hypothetical protein
MGQVRSLISRKNTTHRYTFVNHLLYISYARSWLRHYATNRKVAGSNPYEEIGFYFNLPNSSSRTVALGSTQPLIEVSTRNLPGG